MRVFRFGSQTDEEFVDRAYRELLCRPPEPETAKSAVLKLRRGDLKRSRLLRELVDSAEYEALRVSYWKRLLNRLDSVLRRTLSGLPDHDFIERAYRDLLDRSPEVGAAEHRARELRLGLTRRSGLRREIMKSAEYGALHVAGWNASLAGADADREAPDGVRDEDFIETLYRDLLGRSPEPAAVASGMRRIRSGAASRRRLFLEIATSSECDAARVPSWRRGANRADSTIRRLLSGETDDLFVRKLYEELLCRKPEAEALVQGTRKLRLGLLRRGRLRREIAASPEFASVAPVRARRDWLRGAPAPRSPRCAAVRPPEEVWLELTTRCNIVPACAMCGYADDHFQPKRRDMNPAIWRSLLPLLRRARNVGLHGAGEPLLYPHLGDLLEELDGGPIVGFNSNGHLLSRSIARKLVAARLGWISISLDAAAARTYRHIRRRDDFDALLSKIRGLREARGEGRAIHPRIEINMTLMRENLEEAPAFIELAARVGADGVMFQELQPGGAHRVVAPDGWVFDYRAQELPPDGHRDEVLDEARRRAVEAGLAFNCEILYGRRDAAANSCATSERVPAPTAGSPSPRCEDPWKKLLFDVDGNAYVCCIQKTNGILLGRCPSDSLQEIWNGRRARLVRNAMFAAAAPPCCAGCYRTS